jgi:SHOCT-like domain
MSAEERKKILQMVADGKISADQAATLMRALEESAEEEIEVIPPVAGSGPEKTGAPEFDQIRKRARRFAMIPLWIGVFLTVLSAWAMFSIQQTAGFNFWFFFMVIPLVLGILLIALGAGSQSAPWIYVNVDRSNQSDWPRNITFGLPLPLGLASWFLRTFGTHIEGLKHTNVDEVIQAISLVKNMDEPLIINANDDEDGERVQVFIG